MKTRRITYNENETSKNWMDNNLKPQEQSGFIRDAVLEKISTIKSQNKKQI